MIAENFSAVAENLERQELDASLTGVSVAAPVYSQLLAIYLYQNDLCNAKYLWKRIPASVKNSHPELQNIWKVGQKMWQRDFPGIYTALNEQWSVEVAEIMKRILEKVRQKAANLISTAYSFISLENLASFTGLPAEEAAKNASQLGWQIDTATGIVRPCRPPTAPISVVSCEDQLQKLTTFVSFLEN